MTAPTTLTVHSNDWFVAAVLSDKRSTVNNAIRENSDNVIRLRAELEAALANSVALYRDYDEVSRANMIYDGHAILVNEEYGQKNISSPTTIQRASVGAVWGGVGNPDVYALKPYTRSIAGWTNYLSDHTYASEDEALEAAYQWVAFGVEPVGPAESV